MISVIIPTYNGEKTLERAIKSVLNQTYKTEYEILICDDFSTDKTIEIALKYKCRISRNLKRAGGPNVGRNRGIKKAKGELIALLDQDDEWLPDKIEKQIKEINKGNEFIYSSSIKREVTRY